MKNPNGYGSVVKLSGNRRKPYCARKTSGWNDKGHPIYMVIGYIFWNAIMEQLKMNHTPHECRHTFRSRLDSAGANKRCIDLLMGHTSKDVGERVYTHKTLEELQDTIFLLR